MQVDIMLVADKVRDTKENSEPGIDLQKVTEEPRKWDNRLGVLIYGGNLREALKHMAERSIFSFSLGKWRFGILKVRFREAQNEGEKGWKMDG